MGTAGRRSDVMPSSCLRGVVSVCTRHVLCMDGEHPQPLMGDDNSGACTVLQRRRVVVGSMPVLHPMRRLVCICVMPEHMSALSAAQGGEGLADFFFMRWYRRREQTRLSWTRRPCCVWDRSESLPSPVHRSLDRAYLGIQ